MDAAVLLFLIFSSIYHNKLKRKKQSKSRIPCIVRRICDIIIAAAIIMRRRRREQGELPPRGRVHFCGAYYVRSQ